MRRGQMAMVVLVVLGMVAMVVGPGLAQEEAPAPEARLLRLNFAEGEELTYRVEMNGVGSVQVMGGAQQIAVDGTMDMHLKVEEVTEEGNFQILTSLDAAHLGITANGQAVPLGRELPKLRTVITPRGETLSLELVGGQASGQMEEQISQLLAGENFKSLMQVQKMAAFPEDPVAPGAQWSASTPEDEVQEGQTPTVMTTTYVCDQQFEDVNCARLQTEATVGMETLGPMARMLGMTGATNTTSTTWFDYAAGRIRATDERAQVVMEMAVPAAVTGGMGEVGLFMEMFMESKSWLLPAVE